MMKKPGWKLASIVLIVVSVISFAILHSTSAISGFYAKRILAKSGIELSAKEFVDAACQEDVGTIALMLDAGIDVNAKVISDRPYNVLTTAIHCAASSSNSNLVKILLDHGAFIESTNQFNETPLMAAVGAPPPRNRPVSYDTIKLLLSKGANIGAMSDRGGVLHIACRTGNMKLVNFLLDNGANPLLKDSNGDAPINICANYNGEVPYDRLFVKGVNLDVIGQDGMTLLTKAVQANNVKLIDRLLGLGVNPNVPDQHGNTPLILSVRYPETLELLVSRGADVNLTGKTGTPLIAAINGQSLSAVGVLLEKGADPKIPDEHGDTALHHAAQHINTVSVIERLIHTGAAVNAVDLDGNTPLHLAVRGHVEDAVNLLLANGASVNVKNYSGQTPLAIAKSGIGQMRPSPAFVNGSFIRPILPVQNDPGIEKALLRYGGRV